MALSQPAPSWRAAPRPGGLAFGPPPFGPHDMPVAGAGGARVFEPDPEERTDEIDLRAVVATLWCGKWIVAICVLFAGVMGALLTTQQPARYLASAKVMFETTQANIEPGEAVLGRPATQGPLQNQIEVLRSAALIQRVVDTLDLTSVPAFNPALRPAPAPAWYARLGVSLPDGSLVGSVLGDLAVAAGLRAPVLSPVLSPVSGGSGASLGAQPAADDVNRTAIDLVRAGLQLRPIPNSRVIEIGFVSGNPALSAALANTVAEQYIVDQLEGKLETFRAATAWLTDRVAQLQTRVREAEEAVLTARARMTDAVGTNLRAVQQQITVLSQAQGSARGTASTLQARHDRMTLALESGNEIALLPEYRDVPPIKALLQRAEALRAQDAQLSATLSPGHPSRQRITDALTGLRADIRREARRLHEGLGLQLDMARGRVAQLGDEIAQLEAQELQLQAQSVQIHNLEREAQASRILYENLLSRLQETNAQEDLQRADARILTPAEVPLVAIDTAQNRTLTIALLAGLVLGVGLVFLLDRLNTTFRSPGQLEQMLGLPVLATVPRAGWRMKRGDVLRALRAKPEAALAESIRNLRTSVLLWDVDAPPKVVMFSSSVPREGKSTTSLLMALTARQMGKSAIIVDCDLRMPSLAKVLQGQGEAPAAPTDAPRPGLLGVIDGTAGIEEAVHVEPETGLHVLTTQPSEQAARINAADVLASERFRALIEDLAERYDLVVLDTPPTLVVTDARIVAGLADAVVFCVRWNSTPRAAVREGLRELASVHANVIGAVVTLLNEKRAARSLQDSYSYYRGHYGKA